MTSPPRLPPVAALQPNASGYGFYLCLAKDARQGRGGGEYLSVVLQDATGQIAARVFDNVARSAQEFEAGEFVKVHGRTQLHNGRIQLLIEKVRRVIDGDAQDGFREEDCTEIAPRPVDEMWAELQALVDTGVENTFVRQLLQRVVAEHETRLRVWPAAMSVHHAYRSGFLEHVLKVTDVARTLARAYGADVDVVTAGALLHDIGKLHELDYETATAYSREGNLLGHITIGAMMVREATASIPGFPEALRAHIEHLVLSHHGERDLGSPVVPMTTEAFIVAMADDLDAKLNQVRRAMAADTGDGEFTAYQGRLERKLWKGPRTPAATTDR
jgi:3'-5' exoribonuclease